uniref:Uncharacterized protein n=1 Tax=Caenorhabditis tropicalis TaxID=1561998 RepID=A0A1I7U5J3_9PELO
MREKSIPSPLHPREKGEEDHPQLSRRRPQNDASSSLPLLPTVFNRLLTFDGGRGKNGEMETRCVDAKQTETVWRALARSLSLASEEKEEEEALHKELFVAPLAS